ncbi:MAG: thioesterase family protein [Pseudomonadota bacterium]
MTRTSFTELLSGLELLSNGRVHAVIPEDWMQGRTTYGGLTAALCHEAAKRVAGDRPLKAVQVAFVGPSAGDVVVSPTVLREGKNATSVSTDLVTQTGIAARCLFTFAAPRTSHLNMRDLDVPVDIPPPADLDRYVPRAVGPAFAKHFEMELASGPPPFAGSDDADVYLWLRHGDETAQAGPHDPTHLLAIGDVPPPAAMAMMKTPGMISSMTWMVEFLDPAPTTEGGWFLNRSLAETAIDGYSAQAMTLWNRAGQPVMVGRQTVAIFS